MRIQKTVKTQRNHDHSHINSGLIVPILRKSKLGIIVNNIIPDSTTRGNYVSLRRRNFTCTGVTLLTTYFRISFVHPSLYAGTLVADGPSQALSRVRELLSKVVVKLLGDEFPVLVVEDVCGSEHFNLPMTLSVVQLLPCTWRTIRKSPPSENIQRKEMDEDR